MDELKKRIPKRLHNQIGASAIEYALALAIIMTMVMAGAKLMKQPLDEFFVCAVSEVASLMGGSSSESCGDTSHSNSIGSDNSASSTVHLTDVDVAEVEKTGATETSQKGVDFLKDIEKLRLKPYDDQTGKELDAYKEGATIGYGHLIKSEEEFEKNKNGITQEEAEQLFKDELYEVGESLVNKYIHVDLEPHEYDALVMLAYNIGEGNFKKSSVAKIINGEPGSSYATLEDAWMAYKISQGKVNQGLINRRRAEYEMYTTGEYKRW